MNIFQLIKILSIPLFLFLTSCGVKNVYNKIKVQQYDSPIVNEFDEKFIELDNSNKISISFENYIFLKNFKNDNPYYNNIKVIDNLIYAIDNNNLLLEFKKKSGDLSKTSEINFDLNKDEILISLDYINNSFILAYKSGLLLRINTDGEIIWSFKSNKILNTPVKIFNEQIIILYGNEIKSLSISNGLEIWSHKFDDIPIYQAKGGQLDNFLNLLFFILPNNKIGSVDYSLGLTHNSKFDEIPIISSINNTKDFFNIYKNFLVYLDEGKYLYTYDIIEDEFLLFNENINNTTSVFLFNNSIIRKEGNFLQAINVLNGNSFWLIQNDEISKNSKIMSVRNNNKNIEIYLNDGDLLIINNKEITEIINLDTGKINNIAFDKDSIIIYTKSDKTLIF